MSSTTSAPSTANTACTNLYNTPNQDATCAMAYSQKNIKIMKDCCGDAQVVSYYDNCGLYCAALDQTTRDLQKCMWDKGAAWEAVFCSNKTGSSVTVDPSVPATAQATVISDDDKDDDKDKSDDKDGDDDDSDASSTESASSAGSTNSGNAAAGTVPQSGISTLGFTISVLLFSSIALGAFQL